MPAHRGLIASLALTSVLVAACFQAASSSEPPVAVPQPVPEPAPAPANPPLPLAVPAAPTQQPEIVLPLRVHLMSSAHRPLQGNLSLDSVQLDERLARINQAFAPARIRWTLENTRTHRIGDTTPWKHAADTRDQKDRAKALSALVDGATLLYPKGLDLFVGRTMTAVGFGGAFKCGLPSQQGRPAAFIGNEAKNDKPLPTRKWAHELGHALGLKHTVCDVEHADALMMSGTCEHAKPHRVALSSEEIEVMRAQARRGHAKTCN